MRSQILLGANFRNEQKDEQDITANKTSKQEFSFERAGRLLPRLCVATGLDCANPIVFDEAAIGLRR